MAKLFISYADSDRVMVESLAERLRANGHDPWMAAARIQGGSQWETEIVCALAQCERCLIAVTPCALQSEWVKKETEIAKKLQKPLIPLIVQAVPMPGGISSEKISQVADLGIGLVKRRGLSPGSKCVGIPQSKISRSRTDPAVKQC